MNDLRGTSRAQPKNFGARYLERGIFGKSFHLNRTVLNGNNVETSDTRLETLGASWKQWIHDWKLWEHLRNNGYTTGNIGNTKKDLKKDPELSG